MIAKDVHIGRKPEDYSAEFPLDPEEHKREMKHGSYRNAD